MKRNFFAIASAAVLAMSSFMTVSANELEVNIGNFENNYTPDYAYVDIKADKILHDGDLEDGQFSFLLSDEDGNEIAEAVNDEDGNITFEDIEFTSTGEFVYSITEINDGQDGITYDGLSVDVTIVVTYNEETESLEAEVSYPDDTTFDNYAEVEEDEVTPAYLKLYASKTLTDNSSTGRELEDEEFTFKVKDEDGEIIVKATNDEDGDVVFDAIEISEEGTYVYTVQEVISDDDEHITYDETVYTVTVIATEEDGEIVLELDSIES